MHSIVISPQNLLNKPYTEMVTLNGGFCEEEALAQKMQAWEEYKVCQNLLWCCFAAAALSPSRRSFKTKSKYRCFGERPDKYWFFEKQL